MLLLIALWAVALGLLWAVVRGPERWHRSVTLHLRPDAAEPTHAGMALLFWRHLVLLVVVGTLALVLTRDALGPSDEDLLERTGLVADLVPSDELDAARLRAELVLTEGDVVAVDDVTSRLPDPRVEDDTASTVTTTHLEVRSLGLRERLDDGSGTERDPAACVEVRTETYAGTDLAPTVLVSVTEGACSRGAD